MCNKTLINELVTKNIELVPRIVRRFEGLDRNDATSEGNFALFQAAKRFVEHDMHGNFHGYAAYAIKNALIDASLKKKREECFSLDWTYKGTSTEDSELSLLDLFVQSNDEFEYICTLDMVRDFYEMECTPTERHIMATKIDVYKSGSIASQAQLCSLMGERYGDTRKQPGLYKRMQRLGAKFTRFTQACSKGERVHV